MRGLLLILTAATLQAADDVPSWVRDAAAQTVPSYPAKVNSVVLLREETVTVEIDGKRVMRERGAIKILHTGASVEAYRTYNTKNGRIRDFQGWLIPPNGKPTSYPKNRIVDVAVSRDDVYDEARAKVLECGSAAPCSTYSCSGRPCIRSSRRNSHRPLSEGAGNNRTRRRPILCSALQGC